MGQIETIKISVNQLQTGMYVSALDRPWLETPFMTQGFLISRKEQIHKLAQYCQHVYIDSMRGISVPKSKSVPTSAAGTAKQTSGEKADYSESFTREMAKRITFEYKTTTPVAEELGTARQTFHTVLSEFDTIAKDIRRGSAVKLDHVAELVPPMVNSIVRNPDAGIWLAQLKSRDTYTYRHCLSMVIWCSVIGRQLGLPKKELEHLSLGGLLCDIGKLRMPEKLLNKPGKFSEREFDIAKKHVDVSLVMVKEAGILTPIAVREMIRSHHERWDGSGYPRRLKGEEIPLYARIAAIADCYDAMTSNRVYASAIPHVTAIKNLHSLRGVHFQKELVDAFVRSVGIYPIGTIIELTNGEVGIVVRENPGQRLRPKLLIVLDAQKRKLSRNREVNLAEDESYNIYYALEPGAYGLNPEKMDLSGMRA